MAQPYFKFRDHVYFRKMLALYLCTIGWQLFYRLSISFVYSAEMKVKYFPAKKCYNHKMKPKTGEPLITFTNPRSAIKQTCIRVLKPRV